jgi:apurinic endonuclease APN1
VAKVGTHIRLETNILDVIQKAIRLNLPHFQTFAASDTGANLKFSPAEVTEFIQLRRKHFQNLYLHSSYWVNLARENPRSYSTFLRELHIAEQLEFTHFIIHPGAANPAHDTQQSLRILANNLNKAVQTYPNITLLLENTAHGGHNIGSDIKNFQLLIPMLKFPEKIKFCIDTSHAHAYGYDLINADSRAKFIELLEKTISIAKIDLIHLNDTYEKLGSKIDRHLVPGEGQIGSAALQAFIQHPSLKEIPIILELPKIEEGDEIEIVTEISTW